MAAGFTLQPSRGAGSFLHPRPRARYDLVEIALGFPSRHPLRFLRIGHQNRRIARPPWSNFSPNPPPSRAFRRTDDIEHGMSHPVPRFSASAPSPFLPPPPVRYCNVRISQIVQMDVIANAGASPSQIVPALNLQFRPVLNRSRQRQRNQVSLGKVDLARLSVFIGSGGVGIAQADRTQTVSAPVSLQRILKKYLGRAIRGRAPREPCS